VRICRAAPADAPALARLRVAAIATTGAWYDDDQRAAWAALCAAEDLARAVAAQRVWLADDAGAVSGFAAFGADVIAGVYVAPGYARLGIGSELLTTGLNHLPRRTWRVMATRNAVPFYARHGFIEYRDELLSLGVSEDGKAVSFPAAAMLRSPAR
jgi:GNAT superfamily N-acetyltransferase